ncbi:MAG: sensor histidine kinase [Bdellovibrionales bacterium]
MSQASGVLMVGQTSPVRNEYGAERVAGFAEARKYILEYKPQILVFGHIAGEDTDEFCKFALENAPEALWILSCEGIPPSQIIKWNDFGRMVEMIDNFADPTFQDKLHSASERAGEQQQRQMLVGMFEDQSAQLKRLSGELETRVQKRHRSLRKSLRTLDETKVRLESFHGALLGIHRASTVLQMEQTLNEALRGSVKVEWVRVRFENQSMLNTQTGANVLRVEIPFGDEKLRGEVIFGKAESEKFSTGERDFLVELTEALALALSRLHKLEQAETLKAQWQATFDSIPHALCLTTTGFEILKLNLAFQQACSSRTFHSLLGKNAFTAFFGEDFSPPHNMASPFSFRNARTGELETEHFEVVGETLGIPIDNQAVQLILLRSITDEIRYERRILEASKMAELGTIGSSIAHELNNPLGGMLSFLQLILMDLKKTETYYGEIKEMEKAVLRCRDIVLNLLSFARKQDLGEFSAVDLRTVIDRSVKLIELQSKSKGVVIEVAKSPAREVRGNVNALSQALCNILQNSIDAISEKIKHDPLFPGKINIQLDQHENQFQLRVSDNGTGIRPENQTKIFNPLFTTRDPGVYSGMGLTTAFTIVSEHRGTLEILSQTGSGTTAIISVPLL